MTIKLFKCRISLLANLIYQEVQIGVPYWDRISMLIWSRQEKVTNNAVAKKLYLLLELTGETQRY